MRIKSFFEKLNIDTTISNRDKKLLLIVGSILVIVVAYFAINMKLEVLNDKYNAQITKLEKQAKDLEEKTRNEDKYISDTNEYNQETSNILSNYSAGNTRPYVLNFLNTIEQTTGIWLRSVAFQTPATIYTFGTLTPSNPTGETNYSTDMKGCSQGLIVSYEGSYEEWKNFISYVNSYFSKNTIDTISASYDEASGVVSGTVTITMYYITGTDRDFIEPEFSDISTGKTNVFVE